MRYNCPPDMAVRIQVNTYLNFIQYHFRCTFTVHTCFKIKCCFNLNKKYSFSNSVGVSLWHAQDSNSFPPPISTNLSHVSHNGWVYTDTDTSMGCSHVPVGITGHGLNWNGVTFGSAIAILFKSHVESLKVICR